MCSQVPSCSGSGLIPHSVLTSCHRLHLSSLPETPDLHISGGDWPFLRRAACSLVLELVVWMASAHHLPDVQGSLPNQDAACSAGALMPLLDLAAAGPHQLAAKSAALAISALVCNHTANQDAVRLISSHC